MNVKEIVKKYLEDNGYDGLVGDECGCRLDELFICDSLDDCVPGHKVIFGSLECDPANCEGEVDCRDLPGELRFCIRPGKREGKK